jgi:SAM-dependent methyltransferase
VRDMGRFASTVPFYARYREPYPVDFFREVAKRIGLSGREALLDVACGPGLLAIGFAPYVRSCTGVDPEPGMISEACRRAAATGVHLRLIEATLEQVPDTAGPFDVITIGRALHWLPQESALRKLEVLVAADGRILICGSRPDPERNEWEAIFDDMRRKYADDPEQSRYKVDYDEWFEPSCFRRMDEVSVNAVHEVSVEDLVYRALSMSNTSPEVLGERREAFEAEIRAALTPFAQAGRIREELVTRAAVFRR